jgi:C1A family cysteine protease
MDFISGFRPEPLPVTDEEKANWEKYSFSVALKPQLAGYSAQASDLRPFSSPRHDQKRSSTCVAQSTIKALELKRIQKYGTAAHVDLSRLALYFLARELMSPPETSVDKGTIISLAADALRRFGVCEETLWPFTDDLSQICTSPTWSAMRRAYVHKISSWHRITETGNDRVDAVILALASGNPVVYGTKVGDNWMQYTSSSEPLGIPTNILGGHATVLEGWNNKSFLGENSWGTWGKNGFYEIQPEVIASDSSSDFVVIQAGFETYTQVAA